jgi:Restriction endonuclease BamHI
MRWLRTIVIFNEGNVVGEPAWDVVHSSYVRSIQSIEHPQGAGNLTLRRKMRMPNGQWRRNGVGYLRSSFLQHMVAVEGWRPEHDVNLARNRPLPELSLYPSGEVYREPITSEFGGFDFLTLTPAGLRVAIEWETGNISSSHRSMNKLSIALSSGVIQAGVLIVPSRACYEHLTDRIGNIGELSGYLELWESARATVDRGLLAISIVEQDALTDDAAIPYLPMGSDGRAAQGRTR